MLDRNRLGMSQRSDIKGISKQAVVGHFSLQEASFVPSLL